MEENVQQFIEKVKIVRQWYDKVASSGDLPISEEAIVVLLDTLGAI
jgi:hypothetical protein